MTASGRKLFQIPILALGLLLAGCREEYDPQVKSSEQSVLVVEGVLNSSTSPTAIRLSRTFKLDDSARLRPETGAQVFVEGKSGTSVPLYDMAGNGIYTVGSLNLETTDQYRLHIITSNNREYASDFAPVLTNPPIDSISWKRNETGVTVFANTHNPGNNTRYYRWEYDETWEIRSAYFSSWKLVNRKPERRDPDEYVYTCWRRVASSSIISATTVQLTSDVVFEKPLLFIPAQSDKLSERYSVLVRQYALDKRGYEFYQLMKKNSESLGSVFDAQPSEISGNIRCLSDPVEPVIGYITVAPVQETRIFISKDEVPDWGFRLPCVAVTEVANHPDSIIKYFNGSLVPYASDEPFVTKFYSAEGICSDCTMRGGATQRPPFW